MDCYDLSTAEVGEELQSPLHFEDSSYTTLDEFIQHINELPEKPVYVPMKNLSVNGKVVKDSFEKYLSAEGESSTALKEMCKTPIHYLYYKQQEFKPKNTNHFVLGTFAHQAFLEPSKFDKVVAEPTEPLNTKEGVAKTIEWYWNLLKRQPDSVLSDLNMGQLKSKLNDLKEDASGYTIVPGEYITIINAVKSSYYRYGGGILPKLMKHVKAEVSMYGVDPRTELKVKVRPDAMLLEEDFKTNAVVSFKTTSANTIEAFARDCAKFKYELSEGMYLDVASHIANRPFTATLMVVLQTCIPYQVFLLYWDAEDLEVGKYKYFQAMDQVRECKEKGQYPGYDVRAEQGNHGIIPLKLPNYIKYEVEPTTVEN